MCSAEHWSSCSGGGESSSARRQSLGKDNGESGGLRTPEDLKSINKCCSKMGQLRQTLDLSAFADRNVFCFTWNRQRVLVVLGQASFLCAWVTFAGRRWRKGFF
ncbi:unnamed protein product [Litomosoides sigmodontis]|uniref:Uncharacterized protein n=1 Tax=Litomosoides sigmodontis TaxID=42156 RepID=A0A3P6SG16_LITSI|nr:unnamed protein product [Litomosoides sigmodontis]